jgi:hypothetical protein
MYVYCIHVYVHTVLYHTYIIHTVSTLCMMYIIIIIGLVCCKYIQYSMYYFLPHIQPSADKLKGCCAQVNNNCLYCLVYFFYTFILTLIISQLITYFTVAIYYIMLCVYVHCTAPLYNIPYIAAFCLHTQVTYLYMIQYMRLYMSLMTNLWLQ